MSERLERVTARDRDFIFRCALAAHFTSPSQPPKRPLRCAEIARLIKRGLVYNPNGGGYRPTTTGAELVADDVRAALRETAAATGTTRRTPQKERA